jgi:ATP-dependent Clp protease ATP-binding subunit ClpC
MERFTERARKVMALANQEAQRLHHAYIGTEHMLLGLIKEGHGIGANLLKSVGVDLGRIAGEVDKLVVRGTDAANIAKLPQTPEARRVVEHAIEEARKMHHNYVGTEHLLIGMLHEPSSIAAKTLTNLGMDLHRARVEMKNVLGPESAGPGDTSSQLIRRAVECLLRAKETAIAEGNLARATELQEHALSVGAILTRQIDRPDPLP